MRVSCGMELANKDAAGVAEELEALESVNKAREGQHGKHLVVYAESLSSYVFDDLREESWKVSGMSPREYETRVFFHQH